ncbi:UDP-glucuronosyltransferase 1A5-like [Gadus macrocephalus]|uniref:UDP-glucuronosyltransferase 1A5-like n=1 Tax=Gadus macrocephalus TaxID=80720 RepID=UPI0028CBA4E5|nr:UDP-glucuronosyltransferase 1A5-like [Gadus macrocephalus]
MHKTMFLFLLLSIGVEAKEDTAEDSWHVPGQSTVGEDISLDSGSNSQSGRSSADFSGHLLVVPFDGSHWIGIKAIAQEIGRRGHRVTVLMPEITMRMGPGEHFDTVTYPVPYGKKDVEELMATHTEVMRSAHQTLMERVNAKITQIQKITEILHSTAESLLFNDSLISTLQQQRFDAVLTDPMVPTGSLLARKLGLPTLNLLRGIPCGLDWQSMACPSPPSYVPRMLTGFTDRMTFKQRVINTLLSAWEPLMCRLLFWHFDTIAQRFLGEDVGIAEVVSESDIWLQRIDFSLEYPRPLMPNVVLVGGINCDVKSPLPEEMEPWVSTEHGFVVFTLGSMVSSLPEEITAVFIEAFRRIPQKVIWRHTGPVPDNLPENVKIMKWVPQNDLLAHAGARAFITHSGSHGIYEGLCHAVPMVMVPLGGDQPDNAQRMASRGAGVVLDITTVTVDDLLNGLDEVINNTRYKDNLKKLSAVHKDRPMDPLALSVYWTEYVMRHKGARHLRPAAHDLNWFQYHSLDVITFLMTAVMLVAIVTFKCISLCLRRVMRKKKQE